MGPYDRLFDRNHDGVLDFDERLDMDDYYDRINGLGFYANTSSDEDEDDLESELEEAGLDIDELDMMDEDERAQTLEDAGLDPDDGDE
ncbi:MAG: hypothetical protein IJT37_13360 [Lachnospiraceae bacterium]|nr:hypothetical protein [Lachnospiraceae bacterium]